MGAVPWNSVRYIDQWLTDWLTDCLTNWLITLFMRMPMAQQYLRYPTSFPSKVTIMSSFVIVLEKKRQMLYFKHPLIMGRTLTDKLFTTPSFILLTSSYLRTRSYIAIIAPKLTYCIIKLSCIPWTSKFCSIFRWRQSWARYFCNKRKKLK